MSNSPPRQPREFSSAAQRAVADAIEWEELPSLARQVQRVKKAQADGAPPEVTTWGETAAGGLGTVPDSLPFVEELRGLATREVIEPDVFRHFFGPDAEG